jgi:DNA-binding protein HU-beta
MKTGRKNAAERFFGLIKKQKKFRQITVKKERMMKTMAKATTKAEVKEVAKETSKKKVNKSDFIAKVIEDSKVPKKEVEAVLKSYENVIYKSVKKGEDVQITGFGTFTLAKRKARKGRNPKTGEQIKIKASKRPTFKAGSKFKAAVG